MNLQAWRAHARSPLFREGAADMLGAGLGVGAWGLVTGVAMVKSGLGVPLALAMTFLVFAGSAQLASLPLIIAGAPVWLIWATATCVNLRFVIFSAGLRPYFAHLPLRRRLALGLSITGNLAVLGFFKYAGFVTMNLQALGASLGWALPLKTWEVPLPIGISFFTFEAVA